jgi:SAM-dependent methyltransferase
VDLSPLACGLARERCAADIHEASVTALPFADRSFDGIVSADVLYHLEDDAAALLEFFRVLRPGGVLVVNVPAYRWLWSYHDVATHARRRYGQSELRGKLAAAGFAGVRATHWNTLLLPVIAVRRKMLPPPRLGSDVRRYGSSAERACDTMMAIERWWLIRIGSLPFGTSILAVARKPR